MKSLKQSETKSLVNLTEEVIQDLTPEQILGLNPIECYNYNANEIKAIKLELLSYAACRNENFSELTINAWINEFSQLNMSPYECIKRIRLSKHEKKYGASEFAIFMNVNLNQFPEYYKTIQRNRETELESVYGKLVSTNTDLPSYKTGNQYEILDISGNLILLRNDKNITEFIGKEYFNLCK